MFLIILILSYFISNILLTYEYYRSLKELACMFSYRVYLEPLFFGTFIVFIELFEK
jgi:hypothetical protein